LYATPHDCQGIAMDKDGGGLQYANAYISVDSQMDRNRKYRNSNKKYGLLLLGALPSITTDNQD
jgi:hypothetical protein